jgi:hypothetical protein
MKRSKDHVLTWGPHEMVCCEQIMTDKQDVTMMLGQGCFPKWQQYLKYHQAEI